MVAALADLKVVYDSYPAGVTFSSNEYRWFPLCLGGEKIISELPRVNNADSFEGKYEGSFGFVRVENSAARKGAYQVLLTWLTQL